MMMYLLFDQFEGEPGLVNSFVPPCVALVVLVGLGLTHGPLLWDLSLVYRGSLDAVVLAAVIGTIVHLFLWVLLWLLLTVKVSKNIRQIPKDHIILLKIQDKQNYIRTIWVMEVETYKKGI